MWLFLMLRFEYQHFLFLDSNALFSLFCFFTIMITWRWVSISKGFFVVASACFWLPSYYPLFLRVQASHSPKRRPIC